MSLLLAVPPKDLYRFLFENSISGICLARPDGSIIDCNDIFVKITGSKNIDEVLSDNINHFFSNPLDMPFSFAIADQENDTGQYFLQLKSKINGKKSCLVNSKQIELNKVNYLLVNVIDIGTQKYIKQKSSLIGNPDIVIGELRKKLFLSEEKFNKVLEISDSAICIQNETEILFTNSNWEKLTGYTLKEINDSEPGIYIHSDFKKLILNRYRAQLQGRNVPEKYDFKIVTKSETEIWVNAKSDIVDYEDNKALMTVFVDITKRKLSQEALRESKKKFQSLFYENNSIMFVVDPKNGNITDANEAACKFYGYAKAKIISLNITDLTTLSEDEIKLQFDEAMQGKRNHYFFKHKLANNEIRDVEVYSGKVEIKETILLYSIVHDITARKKAEEALRKSEAKLKELNAQKDRFFSIIAHDLRGPLGTFMQMTEYIKENYSELNEDDFENYFNHLYISARGTFKLLENLLIWTRSQLDVIKLKPSELIIYDLIEETISIYSESARSKNLTINNLTDRNLIAYADKNTMDTVIRNLLSNAIKFTSTNGKIDFCGKMKIERNKKIIELCISDNGIGISEENIEKLFRIEENYTTEGTNNEKGTGLGLILCKELVIKNGGDISVSSKKGKGTTFCINLPVEP